jgi:hypothetical protein
MIRRRPALHVLADHRRAAAVLVASEERARDSTDRPVWIRGTAGARRFQLTSLHEDYAHWPPARAAQSAWDGRSVGAARRRQVHDCLRSPS